MGDKAGGSLDHLLKDLPVEERQFLEEQLLVYGNAWMYREAPEQPYRVLNSFGLLELDRDDLEELFKDKPKSIAGTLRKQAALDRVMSKVKFVDEEDDDGDKNTA